MPNSTNYSIPLPADTDLVKDGASAMRSMGNSIDSTIKALNPETTLGDISYQSSTANTKTRLPIGSAGQVLGVSGGVPAWINNTTTSWTNRTGALAQNLVKVEFGNGLYVAVGDQGQMLTSTNATSWTSRTSGFGTNNINDVFYGNGLWVAVGSNGTITTSTDGITWTARTSNMGTNSIRAVTYANSLWVAVGDGGGTTNTGGITYSSDGITWTRKSQSLTVGASYYGVAWNGTNWIVGAQNSTNNYLYASTPSGTWTAGASGSGANINKIIWDGTRHLTAEGTTYRIYYSTSTTLGTTTQYNQSPRTGSVGGWYLFNGVLYVTNGAYYQTLTPITSAAVYNGMINFVPTMTASSSPYIDNLTSAIFANSSGLIFASANGIWTTF